ncbi:hypothetical protein [Candidatus Burkholderia verschuerenii]|uniref:hypothetical protein n=1 Tax=Candidatus Burkholderia verschuerenii TaxID=242163 RepID=UPI00067C0EDD|nr:hypothetical protein [Candidatus Burkholderia verschuerenii]
MQRDVVVGRREVQRAATRPLPMRDAALQRVRAAETLVDQRAHHGENSNAGDPAQRDAVEAVGEENAAAHGDRE